MHFVINVSLQKISAKLLKIQITETVNFEKIHEELSTIKTFLKTLSNIEQSSSTNILTTKLTNPIHNK